MKDGWAPLGGGGAGVPGKSPRQEVGDNSSGSTPARVQGPYKGAEEGKGALSAKFYCGDLCSH